MSLEPNPRRNDYTGDGSTSSYDYDFPISDKSELLVKTRNASYAETTLVLDTDYSVSGVDDDEGGSITLLIAPLASGSKIAILGRKPIEQQNNIGNQGTFRADVIENEFDDLSKVDQEQQEQIGRSLALPDTIPAGSFDPTLPVDILNPVNAGKSVIINDTSDGLALGDAASGGGSSNTESFEDVSADAAAASGTRNYFCDTSGGPINFTLPDPTTVSGQAFEVFNTDDGGASDVNVTPAAGLIQGQSGDTVAPGFSRVYKSNGVTYRVSY